MKAFIPMVSSLRKVFHALTIRYAAGVVCSWGAACVPIHSVMAAELNFEKIEKSCPGVETWITEMKSRADRATPVVVSKPELRADLLRMDREDQDVRKDISGASGDDAKSQTSKIDRVHLQALRKIIGRYGVLSPSIVGDDGFHAFLTLVIHVSDTHLQERVLHAVKTNGYTANPDDLATLADKIEVIQNRPQLYGTQFDMKENKLVIKPVADRENLDARRAEAGLMPVKDYACMLSIFYEVPVQ